ncbi:MAG: TetR/AcrR family transcriptional regulator [Solirubrobacteraceae bacterium]
MTSATRPFRPSPERRRRDLTLHFTDALEPVLATRRYGDLSIEDLRLIGGIARSTFYAYFTDKTELLCAMADEVLEQIFAEGHTWWELPDSAGIPELRAALLPPIQARITHGPILRAITEGAGTDDRLRGRRTRLINELADSLTAHIHRAQKADAASPDVDPERTAKWLLWTFDRALFELIDPDDAAETNRLVDAVTMIIWRTLYAGYRPA